MALQGEIQKIENAFNGMIDIFSFMEVALIKGHCI